MKKRTARTPEATDVQLDSLPGHLVRRLQQIAVALFLQETEPWNLTPVQYAVLHAVSEKPGLDQRTLARTVGLDTSTTGGVVDRLEARSLLVRNATPQDRRVRMLTLTDDGQHLLQAATPAMMRAQERMLAPLTVPQRKEFMRLMGIVVAAGNADSRAPSEA